MKNLTPQPPSLRGKGEKTNVVSSPLPASGRGWGRGFLPRYAELHCKTNFSFLEGASHAEELVERAARFGYTALAITDRNSLAGVVRAHVAAKKAGLKLLIGAEITPADAPPVLLFAPDAAAYRRLSRLITRGRRAASKGESHLLLSDVAEHAEGLLATVLSLTPSPQPSPPRGEREKDSLAQYRDIFHDRCHLAVSLHLGPDDDATLERHLHLARQARVPLVATNEVHYHESGRRPLHDVLTAIRHGTTVAALGAHRFANGERYLKSPEQMAKLFERCPEALANALELAGRCSFSMDELRYEYPEELCPPGLTATEHLARLTWAGAGERYPAGVPERVATLLGRELALIAELRYEAFFLTVWDLVQFARGRGILCQGRGSAANSAVCYCLGITAVDPDRTDVLFERFLSRERAEPPDIDVDFEHERREEVIQYIYQKYGRDRAGIAAEVISYRPRSAVRDVGKALGLSLDCVDRLAKKFGHYDETDLATRVQEAGLDPQAPGVVQLLRLTQELLGFPRHLSQHVGGFVITRGPLSEMVPIENAAMPDRTVIQWDKDDLDALGLLKVDCLALGMLTAIRKCFRLIEDEQKRMANSEQGTANGERRDAAVFRTLSRSHAPTLPHSHALTLSRSPHETLAAIPPEDPDVYDMICRADTIGVFQIESRAQMSMLPRLQPRSFYDLVIEVAIVRPGPIQGGMVHPYLRRRNGQEPVTYPSPAVADVLAKTLGVPLFQEQVMRLAMVAAGFSAGDADQLRRAMGAWRRPGLLEQFRDKLRDGMLARGLPAAFAAQLYEQIKGFGEYGFPESHAASFALLAYVSAWLKCHHPAAFTAALLNSQPMGFYAPAQLVRDAQEHGVEVRAVDVNCSAWDCTLEEREGVRAWERESVEAWKRGRANEQRMANSEQGTAKGEVRDTIVSSPRSGRNNKAWGVSPRTEAQTEVEPRRGDIAAAPCRPSGALVEDGADSWGSRPRLYHAAASRLKSEEDESRPALRLGFRMVRGLSETFAGQIATARGESAFHSITDFARRTGASRTVLARLAAADAFGSLGLKRRDALWQVLAEGPQLPLFAGLDDDEAAPSLRPMPLSDEVVADYDSTGLSLKAHPISLVRSVLDELKVAPASTIASVKNRHVVRVAGLVLVRQAPGTAKGTVFVTLEDETGIVNLIVRPKVWQRYRPVAHGAVALLAQGPVERQGSVVHICATKLEDLSNRLESIGSQSRDFR